MRAINTGTEQEIFSTFITTDEVVYIHLTNKKKLIAARHYYPKLLTIIFIFCSLLINAATYYIAPNGSDAASGDITHPFATLNKAWTKVVAGDMVYMRGGTYTFNSSQHLYNKSGTVSNLIKIWAYPGEKPIITKGTGYTDARGIDIQYSNFIHLKGLEITGFTQTTGNSYYFGILAENSNNNIYELLNVHHNGFGLSLGSDSGDNLVLNSDFHHNSDPISDPTNIGVMGQPWGGADGLTIRTSDPNKTNTMRGCRMWWNSDDGVDLFNNNGMIIIENCWAFWNGYQPGTFTPGGDGNGFKLGPPTIDESTQTKRIITNNISFENKMRGFDQNTSKCIMNVYNNTSYHNGIRGFDFYFGSTANIARNNISYADGNVPIFTSQSIVDHNSWNGAVTITGSDFVNLSSTGVDGARQSDGSLPEITFLHLAPGSDLINAGINVGTSYIDSAPDMGAFEFSSTTGNLAPQIQNQFFQINENSPNGTTVGTAVATDPNAGQTLTFSILSGNTNNAFTINPNTGAITVANTSSVNYEITPSFFLTVKVQDNGTGNLSSQAIVTVTILNLNEFPLINNQVFPVNENAINTTSVGRVLASDQDAGQVLTYSILSGNTNNAFSINASSGTITVATSAALNFEITPLFSLVVKVQDNGIGNLASQAVITISLLDVNEPPVVNNQTFIVPHLAANGTPEGSIVATHPDAGQSLSFIIISGNTSNAFSINPSSGIITVANSTAISYQTNPVFYLNVRVSDNGAGNLYDDATITINVQAPNQPPVISNQIFTIYENSPNGTLAGTVLASDPNIGQSLTYSILSGNTNNAVAINAATGAITVANSAMFNYEINPTYTLVVKVQDNGTGNLSSQAAITITLLNINEPPLLGTQAFSLNENSSYGSNVGTILASDPDLGQTLTFTILSGNTNNAFALNAATGAITVITSSALNFESTPFFYLLVKVQDNGIGKLSSQAILTISLLNLNESPVFSNQTIQVYENSPIGTIAGYASASDPDAGQLLTYSLLSGNTNNVFAINSSTGLITVGNSIALNFEAIPYFTLVVKVQDNGIGNLSTQANITVTVLDVLESAASATWPLNINTSPSTPVGNLSAGNMMPGTGIENLSFLYSSYLSTRTYNGSSLSSAIFNNDYLQFQISPVNGNNLTVNSISLNRGANAGLLSFSILYATNATFASYSTVGSVTDFNNVSLVQSSFPGLNIIVEIGKTLYVRIYGWNAGTSNYLKTSSVLISGVTWASSPNLYAGGNNNSICNFPPFTSFNSGNNAYVKTDDKIKQLQDVETQLSEEIIDSDLKKILIFPNPVTNGILNVQLGDGIDEQFDLAIFDLSGKSHLKRHFERTNLISLDISMFPRGVYAIQIYSPNINLSDKFVLK